MLGCSTAEELPKSSGSFSATPLCRCQVFTCSEGTIHSSAGHQLSASAAEPQVALTYCRCCLADKGFRGARSPHKMHTGLAMHGSTAKPSCTADWRCASECRVNLEAYGRCPSACGPKKVNKRRNPKGFSWRHSLETQSVSVRMLLGGQWTHLQRPSLLGRRDGRKSNKLDSSKPIEL